MSATFGAEYGAYCEIWATAGFESDTAVVSGEPVGNRCCGGVFIGTWRFVDGALNAGNGLLSVGPV